MTDGAETQRSSDSAAVVMAVASSALFAVLFLAWERDLLWMLVVILPPIWSPVIYRRFGKADGDQTPDLATAGVVIGLLILLGIGLIVYTAS